MDIDCDSAHSWRLYSASPLASCLDIPLSHIILILHHAVLALSQHQARKRPTSILYAIALTRLGIELTILLHGNPENVTGLTLKVPAIVLTLVIDRTKIPQID